MFVISFMDSVNASQCIITLIFKLSFVSFMFSMLLNSANLCLYFLCTPFNSILVTVPIYIISFLINTWFLFNLCMNSF